MKNVIAFLLIFVSNFVFGQNSFNVTSQSVGVNSSFSLEIGLDNTSEVTAFQFDLSHNESAYELLSGSTLTSRAENHILSVSTVDDTTIRVIVFSSSNEVISIGTGAILNLNFESNNEPGIYGLSMSDIVLSDQNGAALGVSSTGGNLTILGPRYNLVTTAVNFGEIPLNSTQQQSINVSNTGNEDLIISSYSIDAPFSVIDALPVTIPAGNSRSFSVSVDTSTKQVVSKELSFTTNDQDPLRAQQTSTVTADIFAVNEIYIGSGQGESNTEITIPVSISNMESFNGFQFDVTLPNNVSYVENSAVFTSRAEDHTIAGSMINSNTLRFVSYSGSNTNFSGNQGDVFNFNIIPNVTSGTYPLPISNSIISNVFVGDIISDAYDGSFTINSPYLSTSIQTINYGNVPITDVQTTTVTLTNTGTASLLIDELVYNTDQLSFPLEIPTTLEVSQSIDVELTFTPTQIGNFNQDISIRNNSPEEQQIISVLANVFSQNYLTLLDTDVLRGNSYDIPINLVNNDPIRAIQYDINIPEGFTFDIDNVTETSVLNNFTTSISSQGNNNYRFLIYSFSNDVISSGNQTILTLPIFVENSIDPGQYTFEFSDVVLSSQTNQNISSDALSVGYVNVIEDTVAPVITLLGDNPVTIEVGTTYTDAGATAFDDIDGDLTSSIVTVSTVNTAVVGVYTVSYNVSDTSGNAAIEVIRTVNVVDTTIPVITLLGEDPVTIELGDTYTDAGATATDSYDGDITSSIVTVSNVNTAIAGVYTVSYNVSDSNGNAAAEVTRTVNIIDSNYSWTGVADSSWVNTSNWSTGEVPTISDDVVVNGSFANEPAIANNTDAKAKSVTIAAGNSLTIDETSSLTVSEDFTNSGTVTLNSTADDFSSLIVTGTATGNVIYNRYVNAFSASAGGGWDGTGPPVAMSITDFITDNTGVIYQVGDTYALGPFNNLTNLYEYYTTTTAPSAGAFTAGKGYTMATTDTNGATVQYTGTIATTNQSIDVINNDDANGGVGRRWNFVSNPYPSYINGNATAEAINNFMDVNSSVIDGSFLGVYGWNGSSYTTYNNTSDAFSIAPGQGFFVAAASTTNTALDFTTAMRTTTGTGDFVLGPQPLIYRLELKLFNGDTQRATTDFYFRDGLSLDLDPGYDAGAYNQSTKLSTRLPQGSQEFAFAINAMGINALQNTRVPLEIRQNAGQTFRVSMADMNLPEDINVYLEDTLNGTLTSLKDQDFELVAQSNLSGAERFFIIFKDNSLLSNRDILGISLLNVYKVNNESFVTIAGITPELEKLDVTLYNILGIRVREKALNPANATQRVSTDGLASGLYVVQVRSENQVLNKKIIIE